MLNLLSDNEKRIIKECLIACVDWFEYDDGNLSSFLGFTQKQLAQMANQWPDNASLLPTSRAVINVLRYWLFCPVVDSDAPWKPNIASRWEIYKLFIKLRNSESAPITAYHKGALIDLIGEGNAVEYLFFHDETDQTEKITKSCLALSYYSYGYSIFRVNKDLIWYRTAEQYMIAEKARLFNDEEALRALHLETNIAFESPYHREGLDAEIKNFDLTKWQEKLFDIVVNGNEAKFSNSALVHYITSTDDKIIVYANPSDSLLGIGLPENHPDADNPQKWPGLNILGFALMKVRNALYENESRRIIHSALTKAVHNNDIISAQELLATGINLDVANIHSDYGLAEWKDLAKMLALLHYAANSDYREVVLLLLSRGVHVDQRDSTSCTALHGAVYSGHVEMAKILLDAGADVNAQGDVCCCMEAYTPLHVAALWNNGNAAMVRLLLKYNADTEIKNCQGKTVLEKLEGSQSESKKIITEYKKQSGF